MKSKVCKYCGSQIKTSQRVCIKCTKERERQYAQYTRNNHSKLRKTAYILIGTAISHGDIQRLGSINVSIKCVDCGKPARHWDHRDYEKPFEIEPVCGGCNLKRGPGKNAWKKDRKPFVFNGAE